MKIIADTNVLVRLLVKDNEAQFNAVVKLFNEAAEIVVPTHVFCELVWVLSAAYKIGFEDISEKVSGILQSHKIIAKEDEIEAGLRMLQKGGDFADGVNAYMGHVMGRGHSVFASFDRQAVRLLNEQGISAMVPQ